MAEVRKGSDASVSKTSKKTGKAPAHLVPTLDRFRNKLLDLTTRNNLLNLSLNDKRTRRLIRFVNVDLQATLNSLRSGSTLQLLQIPDPPENIEATIDDKEFESALTKARLNDPLYQQILVDCSDDSGPSPALANAEDRLRTQVLKELEQRSKTVKSERDLREWVKSQGIDPAYELSCQGPSRGHRLRGIQTLLLEPRLDRIAEAVRKQALSSIEETGNNILYLAFGGLTWTDKKRTFFAPLILLPVEIIKAASRGGAKSFSLRAADDAPVANVALKERLRRDFMIQLPDPDITAEGVDLAPYLNAVAASVAEREGWQVRPFLNVALFNFGGLGLFQDLDPDVIQKSPLVRQLLAAVSADDVPANSDAIADDMDVDVPNVRDKVPVLITQADASQFAAISEVMTGRSLVIEGPPGTGKSQTITNIIANALVEGKRILFVAEKKVALDVVYARLSEAGLKQYCLRIASDKANKREVYDELAERLNLAPPKLPERETALGMFDQLRDGLNQFSHLLNRGFGSDRLSLQSLYWQELRLRRRLKVALSDLKSARFDLQASSRVSLQKRERVARLFEQIAELKAALPLKEMVENLSAIGTKPSDALARDELIDVAVAWCGAVQGLSSIEDDETDTERRTLAEVRATIHATILDSARLPDPIALSLEPLVPLLSTPELEGLSKKLLTAIEAEDRCITAIGALFGEQPASLPDPEGLRAFIAAWRHWRIGQTAMPADPDQRRQLADEFEDLEDRIERLQVVLVSSEMDQSLAVANLAQVQAFLTCLTHLAQLPAKALQLRQRAIWSASHEKVRQMLEKHRGLQAQLGAAGIISSHPVLDLSIERLSDAAKKLRECCELGLGSCLMEEDGLQQLDQQLNSAETLLRQIDASLQTALGSTHLDALNFEQLRAIPEVLKELEALPSDVFTHRSGLLWEISKLELVEALDSQERIVAGEVALRRANLEEPKGVAFFVLRSAAKKLISTPWLLQMFDGDYAKATKLAKSIGATGTDRQMSAAMGLVADQLERRAKFQSLRVVVCCAGGLELQVAARIATRLQELQDTIRDRHSEGLLKLAREITAEKIAELKTIYSAGLAEALDALADHSLIRSSSPSKSTLKEIRRNLDQGRSQLTLLESVADLARWGVEAGMVSADQLPVWVDEVSTCKQLLNGFPSRDLEALFDADGDHTLAIQALEAVDAIRNALKSVQPMKWADDLLQTIERHEIDRLKFLLKDQFLPNYMGVVDRLSFHGVDGVGGAIAKTLGDTEDIIRTYRDLCVQHAALGLVDTLSTELLVSAPIELELLQKRQKQVSSALADLHAQAAPELASFKPAELRQAITWIGNLLQLGLSPESEARCLRVGAGAWIAERRHNAPKSKKILLQEAKAAKLFQTIAKPQPEQLPVKSESLEEIRISELIHWLNSVTALRDHLGEWVRFKDLLDALPDAGEKPLADWLMVSDVQSTLWPDLYRWNLTRCKINELREAKPEIRRLNSAEQIDRRKRFHDCEENLRKLDRETVVGTIHKEPYDLPSGISQGLRGEFTEMALIINEAFKQKRHRPLRHLFQFAGDALRGLKPCWMMSPSTVATLVPRGDIEEFDLVVIDEASQMTPERALGVISRARQCVVVGDPKQLPPTSFFQTARSSEEDGEEDIDMETLEEESILDLCIKTFHPVRRLKWHYRSRHGSLIAFSNQHFYDNQLVIFPACDREFAIRRHLVEAPRYLKGLNEPEVKDVCDVVLEQLESHPDRTLGVVAMNETQADAIGEQLDDLAFHHEELRRRLDLTDSSEGLFVKSLEKVQGDERDTIVISTTYGPPAPGEPVAMRFGPINLGGGHRRLNVLFTRAKHGIELVTSLQSSMIQPPVTASQGVIAFKEYLKYVETCTMADGAANTQEPSSDFEIVLSEVLTDQGFTVDCRVGVANYFIDLAVRHPEEPDRYLLAIESDGESYNSSKAARDRDKYRQAVLENLGWNVYRIWSTDWLEDPDAEAKKLLSHVKGLAKAAKSTST